MPVTPPMGEDGSAESRARHGHPPRWAALLWAAIFVGLPWGAASFSIPLSPYQGAPLHRGGAIAAVPAIPPPPVEPMEILKIAPVEARSINAAMPFSTAPNPAARAFTLLGDAGTRARAIDCLAAAEFYEAGDDASGQEAVAQVVINRMRHPAFPKTICGVVFQGSERTTGCQFTFTCDGALSRIPSASAWERARKLATRMVSGKVDRRVGYATHYHTNWVVPYWSSSLDKITAVDTHLFFRWKGWWGTPAAFRGRLGSAEPAVALLASLSPAHAAASAAIGSTVDPGKAGAANAAGFADLAGPAMSVGRDRIGDRFGPARLAAINSTGDAYVMLLDPGATPDMFEKLALQMCGGRTRCRLLGWTRASDAPNGFPIDEATLATMSYAYMRATETGLERSLFNCAEFRGQPEGRCMRRRAAADARPAPVPAPAPAPAPEKKGVETVRLTP